MKRALLTVGTLNYIPGITATLRTAERFHPDVDRIVYVPAAEVEEARCIWGDRATVTSPPRELAGVPAKFQQLVARTFIGTFDYDAVVYMDCDAHFTAPAPELWDVPPGQINGVKSGRNQTVIRGMPDDMRDLFQAAFPEVCGNQVLNCGVLALRPADWRDLPERFERVFADGCFPRYDVWMDQPLLNVVFAGKINWLDRRFNASDLYDLGIPADVRIMHYTGPNKPWHDDYSRIVPMYHMWLQHGHGETRALPLLLSRLRIALWTPKRLLGQALRKRREARDDV